MNDNSIILLSKSAVANNFAFFRKELGPKVEISAVVKANAYGHGIEQYVPLLEEIGVNHFSVFDFTEAVRVESCLDRWAPIFILGWISDDDLSLAIEKEYEISIFTIDRLEKLLSHAKALNIKAKIHLEVETGMNRSGLDWAELEEAILLINENKTAFRVMGFYTHFSGAGSLSTHQRTEEQLEEYNRMYAYLESKAIIPKYKHTANSIASLNFVQARFDLVRIGIMQYGSWASLEAKEQYLLNHPTKENPLQAVLTWKSKVMSIKRVGEGKNIGYGSSYKTNKSMTIITIPIGYWNGFSRVLSNKSNVLVQGNLCPIIGTVNMNMIIADITGIEGVLINDEVVIIGKQGGVEILASDIGRQSGTIGYEVLAKIPEGIKRVILAEHNY